MPQEARRPVTTSWHPQCFLPRVSSTLGPTPAEKSSSCISLARIKSRASRKGVAQSQSSTLEDTPVLDLSQHYCGPLASRNQRMKRTNLSVIHLTNIYQLPTLCLGSHYLSLPNKPPRKKMALHNYLSLLLINVSFGWAQLRGPCFGSHVAAIRSWLGLELSKGSSGLDDQGGSLAQQVPHGLSLSPHVVFHPPGLLHLAWASHSMVVSGYLLFLHGNWLPKVEAASPVKATPRTGTVSLLP